MIVNDILLAFGVADSKLDRRPLGDEESRELLLMYQSLSKKDRRKVANDYLFVVNYITNYFK